MILAMEALDTFFSAAARSQLPSRLHLEIPNEPFGLPSSLPFARAAASPSFIGGQAHILLWELMNDNNTGTLAFSVI